MNTLQNVLKKCQIQGQLDLHGLVSNLNCKSFIITFNSTKEKIDH